MQLQNKLTIIIIFILAYGKGSVAQSRFDSRTDFSSQRKIENGLINVYAGGNSQFFDNPFFKFKTSKYSNTTFFTIAPKSFGLEIVLPNEVADNTYLSFGLYYNEADMGFRTDTRSLPIPGNTNSGLSGSFAMEGRLMFIGFGAGLYKDIQLYKRFYMGLGSKICIGTYIIDDALKDTLEWNSQERIQPFFQSFAIIDYPPKTLHKINFILKNNINFSYYFSQRVALRLGFVYNIGLPNKVFERNFYLYDPNDYNNPISHEKAVFSGSSAEINFGFSIYL